MPDPNRRRLPPRKSPEFAMGWRACEAGKALGDNPFDYVAHREMREWAAGFHARADLGFSVDHLPRLPSGAFA